MIDEIFKNDPYTREFDANIVEIDNNNIVLDKTAFYAESGGQPGDTGTIGESKVVETIYDGKRIIHIVENHDMKVGDNVHCEIDWNRRYKIMKLHSAAHIVYEFFVRKWGEQKVIGSNISDTKARLDFAMDESISESLVGIEKDVNDFIEQGHGITTADDPEKEGFRWWYCENMKMPCGGTHVKNSKEIGKVRLRRKNLGTGKERIEVVLAE